MKNFIKENWFKLGILIILLLVLFVLSYYFIFFLPQKEQARLNHEKRVEIERIYNQGLVDEYQASKEQQNKISLDICLENADNNYQVNFESYCISEGRGANCNSIKRYNNDTVLQIEKEEKATCFLKYPQK